MSAAQPAQPTASAPAAPTVASALAPSAADIARQVRRQRARRLLRSFVLWVGIPTLLGVVYYTLIARDEFESVATVVLTGTDSEAELRAIMLREHISSRDMVTDLDREAKFSTHFREHADAIARMRAGGGSESRYGLYRSHVNVRYEPRTRVFTLSVRAFSGGDAQRFARTILTHGEAFVTSSMNLHAAPFVLAARPSAPTEATYPHRVYGIFTVFLASLSLFGIGSLLIAAVREHAQF